MRFGSVLYKSRMYFMGGYVIRATTKQRAWDRGRGVASEGAYKNLGRTCMARLDRRETSMSLLLTSSTYVRSSMDLNEERLTVAILRCMRVP